MSGKLTKPQREWLERFAKGGWTKGDIASGAVSVLVRRLTRDGLLTTIERDQWQSTEYVVTPAGRAALAEKEER